MHKRLQLTRLGIPLLLLWALACGPCSFLSSDLPTPPHPIAVSTEAAGQLESRIQQNLGGEPGKQFILRTTDSEVTSLLATKLAEYDESPVVNPQVWFTKGKIYGTGRLVNIVPIGADFYVVASAKVQDGKVMVTVDDISAGAFPIPRRAVDMISQSISETVDELQLGVDVVALEILEGEILIKGTRK